MFEKFTENANKVLQYASDVANELQHNYIGTEHLLIGLVKAPGVASSVLEENGVEETRLIKLIEEFITPSTTVEMVSSENITPRVKKVINQSQKEAVRLKCSLIGTEHLLLGLLKENDCIAVRLLNTLGINIQKLFVDI
ncbi:MAG: ATP-dependent Clp protease ATP-binding subunit ClpC, partial [Clostridium sp.]|nr:ATP-dependent Clp protease ATP-binding subunit ClpC [Clostridium sp.]